MPGTTPAKPLRSSAICVLLGLLLFLTACRSEHDRLVPPAAARPDGGAAATALPPEVAELVERFGSRLAAVSRLAPPAALSEEVREQYGPLVTPALLARWIADPASAPGREVSSPWPERIEVKEARRLAPGRFEILGDVVYVTSVERVAGGAADRRPVLLEVVSWADGEWRLDRYADACSGATVGAPLPEQPELPARVAATRAAIYQAATACDYADLAALAGPELTYSFGDGGAPVAHWRAAEDAGEPVLRRLAEVLQLTPEREEVLWIWPAFFTRRASEWTATDRREARTFLGEEDIGVMTPDGAYLGYRLGIAEDGTWRFFVAGD